MADYCRRTKTEMLAALDCEPISARMVGHSTMEYVRPDGVKVIRYQATDIVLIEPNGTVQLFTDGWRTINTRQRINQYLPAGMYVWKAAGKDGAWWIGGKGKAHRFVEGIKIGPKGGVYAPKTAWRIVPATFKIKHRWRHVSKFEAQGTQITCTLDNGELLHLKVRDAKIGPDLRMHAKVPYSEHTDWVDSDFFTE